MLSSADSGKLGEFTELAELGMYLQQRLCTPLIFLGAAAAGTPESKVERMLKKRPKLF